MAVTDLGDHDTQDPFILAKLFNDPRNAVFPSIRVNVARPLAR